MGSTTSTLRCTSRSQAAQTSSIGAVARAARVARYRMRSRSTWVMSEARALRWSHPKTTVALPIINTMVIKCKRLTAAPPVTATRPLLTEAEVIPMAVITAQRQERGVPPPRKQGLNQESHPRAISMGLTVSRRTSSASSNKITAAAP